MYNCKLFKLEIYIKSIKSMQGRKFTKVNFMASYSLIVTFAMNYSKLEKNISKNISVEDCNTSATIIPRNIII
jgi:hypothetical protein